MEYPLEWVDFPCSPVVGFVGLKDLHTQIAQNFHTQPAATGSGSPSSQVLLPLYALSLDPSTTFPAPKDRRQSLDGVQTKGIFKYNWARKHTRELPIAVAALFDFDEAPDWRERENDIVKEIERVRANCNGRKMKIIVVLVQNRKPAPGDSTVDERLSSLKKRADLEGKGIFQLATYDMRASCSKLEKLLWDASRNMYKDEARRIKKQKERIPRSTQPLLSVRVHFKIAFYAEVRHEYSTALKYYTAAYKQVCDLTSSTLVTLTEVKATAEVIALKMCNIHLANGNVTEALGQFQRHVAHFKKWTGPSRTIHQHLAWMSRQYSLFGDLIESANPPAEGADALRRPGFYYQAAAAFATERQSAARKALESSFQSDEDESKLEIPVFEIVEQPVFLGQMPTVVVHAAQDSDSHPLDTAAGASSGTAVDETITAALLESQVDHSSEIIDLLTRAYEQFKQDNSRRIVLALACRMATAYCEAEKYDMAKKFYDRIAPRYRSERWAGILSDILTQVLKCADHLGDRESYALYLSELIASHMPAPPKVKQGYFASFASLLNVEVDGKPTEAHPKFGRLEAPMQLAMVGLPDPLILCRVHATEASTQVLESVQLRVMLELHGVQDITLDSLVVKFSNSSFDLTFDDSDELKLEPGVPIMLSAERQSDTPQTVTCTQIVATWGSAPACVVMTWDYPTPGSAEDIAAKYSHQHDHHHHEHHHIHRALHFDPGREPGTAFVERRQFQITPAAAKLEISVSHMAPALVNEFLALDVRLSCLHDVKNGLLTASGNADIAFYSQPSLDHPVTGAIKVDPFKGSHATSVKLYIRCQKPGEQRFSFKMEYDSAVDDTHFTITSPVSTVSFVLPFSPLFRFLPSQKSQALPLSELKQANTSEQLGLKKTQRMAPLIIDQAVLLHVELQTSNIPSLELVNVKLKADKSVLLGEVGYDESSANKEQGNVPMVLQGGDKFTAFFRVKPVAVGPQIHLGDLDIAWRREGGDLVALNMALPPVAVDRHAFYVNLSYPAQGEFGAPLELSLEIQNSSNVSEPVSVSMQENESFLFAGYKAATVRVLPHSSATVTYRLVPVAAGPVILPRFQVRAQRLDKDILSSQNRTIFIRPAH